MTTATDVTKARRLWFAACKEAGLDENARKDVQKRVAGKESSSKMSLRDFNGCLRDLQDRGAWKPKKPITRQSVRPKSEKPHVRKVFAIWSDMCRDNIPDNATRAGLIAFVQRMTKTDARPGGLSDPEWMSPEEAQKIAEGLKAWRARELAKRERQS
jgi:hypothetical protein